MASGFAGRESRRDAKLEDVSLAYLPRALRLRYWR